MNTEKMKPIQLPEHLVNAVKLKLSLQAELIQKQVASHKQFWQDIHAEFPQLDKDENYRIDDQYIENGIVFLKEKKASCDHIAKIILKDIFKG